jgi:ABC-type polysaccharide/polyol phosphate transport system ATPase subunit
MLGWYQDNCMYVTALFGTYYIGRWLCLRAVGTRGAGGYLTLPILAKLEPNDTGSVKVNQKMSFFIFEMDFFMFKTTVL